jgi:hypothetical protein
MAKTPAKSGSSAVKGSSDGGNDSYYCRLLIDKSRRSLITLAVVAGFAAFCTMIARELNHPSAAWWLPGLPITVLGLMIAAVPLSEKWEYKPWQARARQYERNQ